MAIYKEKIVDAITNKETWRDYTAAEVAEVEAAQVKAAARDAQAEAKVAARASALSKLAALGLSADEIAAL